jgi:subtilase family serine protease
MTAAAVNLEGLPHERHHMTREQFREEHGASTADLTSIQEFARSQNLQVVEVNDIQRSVKLIGSVADFTRVFGVELQQ